MRIWVQKSASIQRRTSSEKNDNLEIMYKTETKNFEFCTQAGQRRPAAVLAVGAAPKKGKRKALPPEVTVPHEIGFKFFVSFFSVYTTGFRAFSEQRARADW